MASVPILPLLPLRIPVPFLLGEVIGELKPILLEIFIGYLRGTALDQFLFTARRSHDRGCAALNRSTKIGSLLHRFEVKLWLIRVLVDLYGIPSLNDVTLMNTQLRKLSTLDTRIPLLIILLFQSIAEFRFAALFHLRVRLQNNMRPNGLNEIALFRDPGDLHIVQLLLIQLKVFYLLFVIEV